MEEIEIEEEMGWGSFIGIFALIAAAIFIGGSFVFRVDIFLEHESVIYPAWTDLAGIVFSIIVLISFVAIWLLRSIKR